MEMLDRLFARKPMDQLLHEAGGEQHLRRVLGPVGLTSLGVGAIIGAGIFVLTGNAAAQHAGPGIVLSFVLSGVGCAFAGLCYAEMASMIPIAGSAYTYSYATMGEFLAWIIGWDLILEYSLGAATVSVGWSGYVVSFLRDFGVEIPGQLIAATGTPMIEVPNGGWQIMTEELTKTLTTKGLNPAALPQTEAWFNLPAVLIVAAVTGLLVIGIKESANVNNVIVMLKVTVLILFIVAGGVFLLQHADVWRENWAVFIPDQALDKEGKPVFGKFGWSGILTGAGVIFFAYIGFDAVSTAAQESKNPQRDMPIGILGSLLICTVIYITVAVVLTGIVHYNRLEVADPVAVGIDATGYFWLRPIVKIGAIAGLSSVILVMLLAQPRIFFTMSRDGLLPAFVAKVHPRFQTPFITTIITGVVVALAGAVAPIGILGHLVSIGTLLAFVLVCAGVLVLRYTAPDLPRVFRTPFPPVTCTLGILVCLAQMYALPPETWERLLYWMAAGMAVYFLYGFWHSKVGRRSVPTPQAPPDERIQGPQDRIKPPEDGYKSDP
jgi:APA family basic amino acid/polyamine antiporter